MNILAFYQEYDTGSDFTYISIPPILLFISRRYVVWYPSKVNWADGKEASNSVSTIETMSTFPSIMVCKSVNLFLTELILKFTSDRKPFLKTCKTWSVLLFSNKLELVISTSCVCLPELQTD